MDFQWNQIHEAGLPSDKEIINNPDQQRIWVVQAAVTRVLAHLIEVIEASVVKKPVKK
jgi:hypothetical protein